MQQEFCKIVELLIFHLKFTVTKHLKNYHFNKEEKKVSRNEKLNFFHGLYHRLEIKDEFTVFMFFRILTSLKRQFFSFFLTLCRCDDDDSEVRKWLKINSLVRGTCMFEFIFSQIGQQIDIEIHLATAKLKIKLF